MDYSNKIYELRKKEDISQEALAALIGTTRQQISRWECGISVPTPKFAYVLAKHFNVTIEELFGEEISAKEKDEDDQTSFAFKSKVIIFTVLAFTNYLLMVLLGYFSHEIALSLYRTIGASSSEERGTGEVNAAITKIRETFCLMGVVWVVVFSLILLLIFALLFVRYVKATKSKLICSTYVSSFVVSYIAINSTLIAGVLTLTIGQHMSYLPPSIQFFNIFDGLIFLIGSIFVSDVLLTFLKMNFYEPLKRVVVLPQWIGARKVFDIIYSVVGLILTISFIFIGAFSYVSFYIAGFVFFPTSLILLLVRFFISFFPFKRKEGK